MKEVRYWEAEDGTRFEDGESCYNYEINEKINSGKADLKFYDDCRTQLFKDNLEDNFINAHYIFIGNEVALNIMKEFKADFGYNVVPLDIGFWKYEEDTDNYIS